MPDYVMDVNPLDGSVRYFHTDEAEDRVTIYTEYEAAPLVDKNKWEQNSTDNSERLTKLGDAQLMYKVGTIAPWEMTDLVKRGILNHGGKILDDKAFSKWLMDPDFKHIRRSANLKLGV